MPLSSLVPGTGTHAGTGTMSIRIWATARTHLTEPFEDREVAAFVKFPGFDGNLMLLHGISSG